VVDRKPNEAGGPFNNARNKERFLLIEGMRGIAALLIVTRHVAWFSPLSFPVSYLAVDLFYLLSGFVIPYSYEMALASNQMSATKFMMLRMIRLYPLYLFFSILGVCEYAFLGGHHSNNLYLHVLMSFLFLPTLRAGTQFYPFDYPSWSLFFELFVSGIYGIALVRLSNKSLAGLAALSFLVLAYGTSHDPRDLDIGWMTSNFIYGFFRVSFSFILGMLVFRRYFGQRTEGMSVETSNMQSVAILLLAATLLAVPIGRGISAATYDLIAISVLFPLLLLKAIRISPTGYLAGASTVLGIISYPVYVAHVPSYHILKDVLKRTVNDQLANYAPASGLVFAILLGVICYVMDVHIDLPLRRKLRSLVPGRRRVPQG